METLKEKMLDYLEGLPPYRNLSPQIVPFLYLARYLKNDDYYGISIILEKHIKMAVCYALGIINTNKRCLVLQGPQGCGKSTFLNFLCPPELKDTGFMNYTNIQEYTGMPVNSLFSETNKEKIIITIDFLKRYNIDMIQVNEIDHRYLGDFDIKYIYSEIYKDVKY